MNKIAVLRRFTKEEADDLLKPFDYVDPKPSILEKALPWLLAGALSTLIVMGVILGAIYGMKLYEYPTATTYPLPTTTYYSAIAIGKSCTSTTQCVATAYCDSTTGLCACSPQLYYDSSTGICRSRKTYGSGCSSSTECEYFDNLSCVNKICSCDSSIFFWNSTAYECQDLRGFGQNCSSSTQCVSSSMVCSYYNSKSFKQCVCSSGYYFSLNTGSCQVRKSYASECNYPAHFECKDNMFCGLFPSETSVYRCNCHPTYYWNSTVCLQKKPYGSSCTYDYECFDYQGQVCTSSLCGCPTNTFWNLTNCDPKKPFGGTCNVTSNCLNTNTVCLFRAEFQDFACLCPSGYYFSLTTNACTAVTLLGSTCTDASTCPINATCIYTTSSPYSKVCQCTSLNYYQQSTTSCALYKTYLETCSSATECNSLLGLTLCSSSKCSCSSNYFWNGNECEIQRTSISKTYNPCYYSYQCKNSNCYDGACDP